MSRETFAILIVAGLFGLFLLLVAATLIRSRYAAKVFKEAAAGAVPRPEPEAEKKKPKPVSRREVLHRSLLASLGLFFAQFGAATLAFIWPNLRGGFGAIVDTGLTPEAIKSQIDSDRLPFYYGVGRFYIVKYDEDPVPDVYEGLVSEGLMALYQKCVHLGCRVPFCQVSQWFECPCHGSKYNRVGEWQEGPAPRGLDRFPVVFKDGTIQVDTSTARDQNGPPRGTDTIQQRPEGAYCVNVAAEE
ncbi:MAG: ubiquinol-cytochrome c reductase iron-sulfur subunit [Actinomycetota bacterium]